jgi:hypothetical protein
MAETKVTGCFGVLPVLPLAIYAAKLSGKIVPGHAATLVVWWN